MERGLRKILRQQAEARDDGRPRPARRREVDQGRLDGVAGLGAVDVDRPGDRVDPVEVEIGDRLHAGIGRDLAAHRVDLRERDGLPRCNGRRRLAGIVPGHVLMAGVNGAHADRPVRSAHQPISLSANSAKPPIYGSVALASIGYPPRFERRVFTRGDRLPGARLPKASPSSSTPRPPAPLPSRRRSSSRSRNRRSRARGRRPRPRTVRCGRPLHSLFLQTLARISHQGHGLRGAVRPTE